ncbi:MAG: fibronectin type III domain-containing protein [Syntrophaceae bacterium]
MKCLRCNLTGKGRFKIIVSLMIMAIVHTQALAAGARISWNANTERDLLGYNVYYGTMPHIYSRAVNAGKFTTVDIGNLKSGQTYYVAVTAYNAEGESDFSDEQSVSIPGNEGVSQTAQSDEAGESGGGGGGCFIAVSSL